ncbi:MAG: transposase [Bacteroidales bacterium]|nr:transposase [Bacteroidales bacterium]
MGKRQSVNLIQKLRRIRKFQNLQKTLKITKSASMYWSCDISVVILKQKMLANKEIHYYHVCTDGTKNGIVYSCENDYQMAIKISAVVAYRYNVEIICYCHMTTHSHFVIRCSGHDNALSFINRFKTDYGRYVLREHGNTHMYRKVKSEPIEITDNLYLRKCISYVLLNPVKAHIVDRPEDYMWSSFECYFNASSLQGTLGRDIGVRRLQKEILHTHYDLSKSGLMVKEDNSLEVRSFVDYRFVERLFKGRTEFYKSLALTNSDTEEAKYVAGNIRYNDLEILAETIDYSDSRFGVKNVNLLTKNQKYAVVSYLRKRCHASNKRLSRILKIDMRELDRLTGEQLSDQ